MRRRGHALRKRYGRSWPSLSAITVPAGRGLYDVVLVDNKGTHVRPLARKVPHARAVAIVRERHG
jgi:hypothetical protein